jgi:hypothetical protein
MTHTGRATRGLACAKTIDDKGRRSLGLRDVDGRAAKLLQVLEDPIGGLPPAPEREAAGLADVGASSTLIVDFHHRAQAEMCARCARPWPKEMFSPGIS